MEYNYYTNDAVSLLESLISTPSVSREEEAAADLIENALAEYGFKPRREGNNVWVIDPEYNTRRPTILLNAHIDTVKPVATWTRNPFCATFEGDRLYGLGSNDCGGGLVALLQVFRHYCSKLDAVRITHSKQVDPDADCIDRKRLDFNLVFLASCEEEVSGSNGIVRALPHLPKIDVAIVGEPTSMQPAIAEKGLMVVDCEAKGKSGHAARDEGVNAIYKAIDDINWICNYQFGKVSELLGPTKMTVTIVNAGTQHNVIPDKCSFVIDVRTNEYFKNEEIFEILKQNLKSEIKARSFRLNSSSIDTDHPIIKRCIDMGMIPFGSPTLSDQALMPFLSVKLGPGESSRSHSADEFIYISEIDYAIRTYIELLDDLVIS